MKHPRKSETASETLMHLFLQNSKQNREQRFASTGAVFQRNSTRNDGPYCFAFRSPLSLERGTMQQGRHCGMKR